MTEKKKNGVFSGHYVIASSLPPKQRRPLERRTLVPKKELTKQIKKWGKIFEASLASSPRTQYKQIFKGPNLHIDQQSKLIA